MRKLLVTHLYLFLLMFIVVLKWMLRAILSWKGSRLVKRRSVDLAMESNMRCRYFRTQSLYTLFEVYKFSESKQ